MRTVTVRLSAPGALAPTMLFVVLRSSMVLMPESLRNQRTCASCVVDPTQLILSISKLAEPPLRDKSFKVGSSTTPFNGTPITVPSRGARL